MGFRAQTPLGTLVPRPYGLSISPNENFRCRYWSSSSSSILWLTNRLLVDIIVVLSQPGCPGNNWIHCSRCSAAKTLRRQWQRLLKDTASLPSSHWSIFALSSPFLSCMRKNLRRYDALLVFSSVRNATVFNTGRQASHPAALSPVCSRRATYDTRQLPVSHIIVNDNEN